MEYFSDNINPATNGVGQVQQIDPALLGQVTNSLGHVEAMNNNLDINTNGKKMRSDPAASPGSLDSFGHHNPDTTGLFNAHESPTDPSDLAPHSTVPNIDTSTTSTPANDPNNPTTPSSTRFNPNNTPSNGIGGQSCVLHIRRLPNDINEVDVASLATPFGLIKNMVLTKLSGQALIEMKDEEAAVAMKNYYNNICPPIIPANNNSNPFNPNNCQKSFLMTPNEYPTALGTNSNVRNKIGVQYSRYQTLTTKVSGAQIKSAIRNANMQSYYNDFYKKRVLRVHIKECPETIKLSHIVLYKIFQKFGTILRIIVFKVNTIFPQAFVEFDNHYSAAVAKLFMDGMALSYRGGFLLVEYSSQETIEIRKSNDLNRDYTKEPLSSMDNYLLEYLEKNLGDYRSSIFGFNSNIMENFNKMPLKSQLPTGTHFSPVDSTPTSTTPPMVNMNELYSQIFSMQQYLQERLKCGDKFSAEQARSYVSLLAETLSHALNLQKHSHLQQKTPSTTTAGNSMPKPLLALGNTSKSDGLSNNCAKNVKDPPQQLFQTNNKTNHRDDPFASQTGSPAKQVLGNAINTLFNGNYPMIPQGGPSAHAYPQSPVKSQNFIPRYYLYNGMKKDDMMLPMSNVQLPNQVGYGLKTLFVPVNASPVIIVSHLDPDMITPDILFTLFGVYGDVIRVKIMYSKRDTALVQFVDSFQAAVAIENLNGQTLYGRKMLCNTSKYYQIKLPSQALLAKVKGVKTDDPHPANEGDQESKGNEGSDEAVVSSTPSQDTEASSPPANGHEQNGDLCSLEDNENIQLVMSLTKDYFDSPLHRYKKANSRNFANIYPPSCVLHISNLPGHTTLEELEGIFNENGHKVVKSKLMFGERRMALLQFESVELAIIALIEMHNYPMSNENRIRVCFSRSQITTKSQPQFFPQQNNSEQPTSTDTTVQENTVPEESESPKKTDDPIKVPECGNEPKERENSDGAFDEQMVNKIINDPSNDEWKMY